MYERSLHFINLFYRNSLFVYYKVILSFLVSGTNKSLAIVGTAPDNSRKRLLVWNTAIKILHTHVTILKNFYSRQMLSTCLKVWLHSLSFNINSDYNTELSEIWGTQKQKSIPAKTKFWDELAQSFALLFYEIVVRNDMLLSITHYHNISVPIHCFENYEKNTKSNFECHEQGNISVS